MILGLGECRGGLAEVELQQLVHAVGPAERRGPGQLSCNRVTAGLGRDIDYMSHCVSIAADRCRGRFASRCVTQCRCPWVDDCSEPTQARVFPIRHSIPPHVQIIKARSPRITYKLAIL